MSIIDVFPNVKFTYLIRNIKLFGTFYLIKDYFLCIIDFVMRLFESKSYSETTVIFRDVSNPLSS